MTREEIGRELFEIHNRIEELRIEAYQNNEYYEYLSPEEKEELNEMLFTAQSIIYFDHLEALFLDIEIADWVKK